MDDLSLALSEHGVNVKKPDYCEWLIGFQAPSDWVNVAGAITDSDRLRPVSRREQSGIAHWHL